MQPDQANKYLKDYLEIMFDSPQLIPLYRVYVLLPCCMTTTKLLQIIKNAHHIKSMMVVSK